MFEQSTITSAPASKRLWATCLGFGGQAVLVAIAVIAPMMFPQMLPRATLIMGLTAPGPPPPPPPKGDVAVQPRNPHPAPTHLSPYVEPTSYPKVAAIIIEDPEPQAAAIGVPGGVPGGSEHGVPGSVLDSIITAGQPAVMPAPRPAATHTETATTSNTTQPTRVPQGGLVRPAQLIHRVEPKYPELARAMRVQGVVKLEGVIGTDGTMRELRVLSGPAVLVKAAIDAVSQWVYEPTTLNHVPVEVIAPITVTFHLN